MQVGGSNVVIQSDSGTLVLGGTLQYIGSYTAGRSWNFFGDGDTVILRPILYSSVAPISLGKYGAGTLTLNGTNTYAGPTTVVAGTLGGNGTVAGPVTVLANGALSPGTSIGALTINNALTNYGTLVMELNRTGATLTNDAIKGLSTVVYGGTLQLANTGEPLMASNSFKLFYASAYAGAFTNLTPATPGSGLVWNTNGLASSGTVAVAVSPTPPPPAITNTAALGTNLVFSGTGGPAGAGSSVLAHTNVSAPVTEWIVIGSGTFDGSGSFTVTNAIAPDAPVQFYRIRIP